MKSTLLVLILCLFSMASEIFADSGEVDPLLNNRVINRSINNLMIYHYDPEQHPRIRLLAPLPIYNNKELKGTPSFLIDHEKVIDQRSNKSKSYIYKDHFHYDRKTQETTVKDLPMEFVAATARGFYLGILNYQNGIATVKDKNKEYFLELNINKFSGNKWPSPIWKTDGNSDTVIRYLQNLEKNDKEFQALINPVRKCLNEKNLDCFKKSINDEFNQIDDEILIWNISNDDELCVIFKEDRSKVNVLAKKIKKTIIPWEHYLKGFSFKDRKIEFKHTIEEFGKSERIDVFFEGKQACEAGEYFELNFERKLEPSSNKWEMEFKRGFINPVS